MQHDQIQKVLEYGREKPFVDLISFLQNDLNLDKNERIKAQDFLLDNNLFVSQSNMRGTHKITPFALNILKEEKTYEAYLKNEEIKANEAKEKERLDLDLARKMLDDFPKTKLRANIGLGIALVLFIVEIVKFILDFKKD